MRNCLSQTTVVPRHDYELLLLAEPWVPTEMSGGATKPGKFLILALLTVAVLRKWSVVLSPR